MCQACRFTQTPDWVTTLASTHMGWIWAQVWSGFLGVTLTRLQYPPVHAKVVPKRAVLGYSTCKHTQEPDLETN